MTIGTTHRPGKHVWNTHSHEDQVITVMYVLLAPCFSAVSAFFTKASIMIGLMRILGHIAELSHKLIAYVPLAIVLIGALLFCCAMLFFCWPVEKT